MSFFSPNRLNSISQTLSGVPPEGVLPDARTQPFCDRPPRTSCLGPCQKHQKMLNVKYFSTSAIWLKPGSSRMHDTRQKTLKELLESAEQMLRCEDNPTNSLPCLGH